MEYRMQKRLALAILMAATVTGCATGRGRDQGWQVIGSRQVTDGLDHDVIPVTSARGDFRRIKFVVQSAPIDFHRVIIHYGNGADQVVAMRRTVGANQESRAIDLDGSSRVIRSVEFWYDANTNRGRRAQVRLLARR